MTSSNRRGIYLVASLLTVLIASTEVAPAQPPMYAGATAESADKLAQRSLTSLHRGEDATTKEAKLAAYREGLVLARRSVEVDGTNADAHFAVFANMGRIIQLEGIAANPFNLLPMTRALDRALELDPNHVDALAAKGRMYRRLPWFLGGSLDKAADYLERAVALDPDAVGARIELAETYRDLGHPERAVPLLQAAAQVAAETGRDEELAEACALLGPLSSKR